MVKSLLLEFAGVKFHIIWNFTEKLFEELFDYVKDSDNV